MCGPTGQRVSWRTETPPLRLSATETTVASLVAEADFALRQSRPVARWHAVWGHPTDAEGHTGGVAETGTNGHPREVTQCPLGSITVPNAQWHAGRVAETGTTCHPREVTQGRLGGVAVPDAQRHAGRVAETDTGGHSRELRQCPLGGVAVPGTHLHTGRVAETGIALSCWRSRAVAQRHTGRVTETGTSWHICLR